MVQAGYDADIFGVEHDDDVELINTETPCALSVGVPVFLNLEQKTSAKFNFGVE